MKEPVVSDDLRCRKLDTQSGTTTGLEIEIKSFPRLHCRRSYANGKSFNSEDKQKVGNVIF